MTKKELMYNMAVEAGLSATDATRALNAFIKIVGKTLRKGEPVSIMGFGTFFVSDSTTMQKKKVALVNAIPEKEKIPRFKVSPKLTETVKSKNKK